MTTIFWWLHGLCRVRIVDCLALIMYFTVLTHHAGQMSSGAVRKLLVKGSQKKYDETLTAKLNAITRFQQAKRTTKALEAAGVSLEQYMLRHKTVLLHELYTFELDKIKTKLLEKVVVLQNIDVEKAAKADGRPTVHDHNTETVPDSFGII